MWRWLLQLAAALGMALAGGEDFGLQLLQTGEDIASFVRRVLEPRHAVAVLTVSQGSKRHALLQELADDEVLRNILTFGVAFIGKGSSLTVHRHRYPPEVFDGKWTRSTLHAWLLEVGYPLVNRMVDSFSPAKYFSATYGVVLIVKSLNGQTDDLVRALEPFAKQYKGRLKFSFFTKSPSTQKLCDTYGVWSNDELLIIEQPTHVRKKSHSHVPGPPKFRLEGVTAERMEQFFAGYGAGSLPRYLQPSVPRVEASRIGAGAGAVRELTSWDFVEVVDDARHAVLVEFVSAGCEPCEEFREAYEEAGRRARAAAEQAASTSAWRGLVVARIDQTANEHTQSVRGTPWMKFWPRGPRRKPMDVELRSVESIMAFLEEQLSDEGSAEL